MMKNCDLGLENAALGLRASGSIFKTSVSVFTIRTSLPANNTYIFNHGVIILLLCSRHFC